MKAGITLNPDTPFERVRPFVAEADIILIMSVFPGFGGQSFIPETLDKVRAAAAAKRADARVEIDGGINAQTAPLAREAGVDILVAGAYFYGSKDRAAVMRELKK